MRSYTTLQQQYSTAYPDCVALVYPPTCAAGGCIMGVGQIGVDS